MLSTLRAANAPLPYTVALVAGGLWGSVFLHIGVSFPTGRLSDPSARTLAIVGYLAKYAQATQASVSVRQVNGHVTGDVTDDGIGGANAHRLGPARPRRPRRGA